MPRTLTDYAFAGREHSQFCNVFGGGTCTCPPVAEPAPRIEDPLKFCRDCKHADRRDWMCKRVRIGPVSLVTGEPTRATTPMDCQRERDEPKDDDLQRYGFEFCGPEGRYWEKREEPVEPVSREHVWVVSGWYDRCEHCLVRRLDVEDGIASRFCGAR